MSLAFQHPGALYFWLIPAVLGQPFLRLYLLAEHTGCALNDDMIVNTRTTLTNRVIRFLMWNMPYHVEHHMYPSVPVYTLGELHRFMAPDLMPADAGYVAMHRGYWRALRQGKGAHFTRQAIPKAG